MDKTFGQYFQEVCSHMINHLEWGDPYGMFEKALDGHELITVIYEGYQSKSDAVATAKAVDAKWEGRDI